MNDTKKAAYRHLLYVAMLDIRNLCQPRQRHSSNPLAWRRHYLNGRVAGGLADWLHNLAGFSAHDFANFEETHFWREAEAMAKRHPSIARYREIFDNHLVGKVSIC